MKNIVAIIIVLTLLSISNSGFAFQDLSGRDNHSESDPELNDFNPNFPSGSGEDSLSKAMMVAVPLILAGGFVTYMYVSAEGPFSIKRSVEIETTKNGHVVATVEEKGLFRKTKKIVKDLGQLDVTKKISELKDKIAENGLEEGIRKFLDFLKSQKDAEPDQGKHDLEEAENEEEVLDMGFESRTLGGIPVSEMPQVSYRRIYSQKRGDSSLNPIEQNESQDTNQENVSIVSEQEFEIDAPKIENLSDLWNMMFESEDANRYLYDEKDQHFGKKFLSRVGAKYVNKVDILTTVTYAIVPRQALVNQDRLLRLRSFTADEKLTDNANRQYFNLEKIPSFPIFTHGDQSILEDINNAYKKHSAYYNKLDPIVVEITGFVFDWGRFYSKEKKGENPIQQSIDQSYVFEEYFTKLVDDKSAFKEEINIDSLLEDNLFSFKDSASITIKAASFENIRARFGDSQQSDLDFLNFISSSDRFMSFQIIEP